MQHILSETLNSTTRKHIPHHPKCRHVNFSCMWHRCVCTCRMSNPLCRDFLSMWSGAIDRSRHVNLCQASHPPNLVSSISPDSTGAVFFSLCGGVLFWQPPVGDIRQVLHVCLTLGGAAAERLAEARADWSSKKYKHDAVGCSLQGVANSLWGQNKGTEEQRGSNKLLHWNKMSFNGLKLQQIPFYIIW